MRFRAARAVRCIGLAIGIFLPALGQPYLTRLATSVLIFVDRRHEPQSGRGLWRHGQLRPRRLSRHRRLCGGRARPPRHPFGLHRPSRRGARGGARRSRHRRLVAARDRRILHHDHPRLRADDLLRHHRQHRPTAATTGWRFAQPRSSPGSTSKTRWRSTISVASRCSPRLLLCARLVRSRFGRVLRGIKDNERRMQSLGLSPPIATGSPPSSIAGGLAGLAGALYRQSRRICQSRDGALERCRAISWSC